MENDTILQAPREFCITIIGKTSDVKHRRLLEPTALPYFMDRLLSGQPVPEQALSLFGLRLWVEWDTDGDRKSRSMCRTSNGRWRKMTVAGARPQRANLAHPPDSPYLRNGEHIENRWKSRFA
ncbi:hypothetical protein P0F65_13585 [Sphingomonas sp. I4]